MSTYEVGYQDGLSYGKELGKKSVENKIYKLEKLVDDEWVEEGKYTSVKLLCEAAWQLGKYDLDQVRVSEVI